MAVTRTGGLNTFSILHCTCLRLTGICTLTYSLVSLKTVLLSTKCNYSFFSQAESFKRSNSFWQEYAWANLSCSEMGAPNQSKPMNKYLLLIWIVVHHWYLTFAYWSGQTKENGGKMQNGDKDLCSMDLTWILMSLCFIAATPFFFFLVEAFVNSCHGECIGLQFPNYSSSPGDIKTLIPLVFGLNIALIWTQTWLGLNLIKTLSCLHT